MLSLNRILLSLWISVAAAFATTLTGSLNNPDGTGANGRLSLSLSQQGALQVSCGGPAEVVPTYRVNITVINGALQSPPTIYGNDCLLPAGTWYNIIFNDNNGNTIFVDRWLITGSNIDIGTIVSVIVSGTTSTLGGGAVLTQPSGAQTVVQPSNSLLNVNNLNISNLLSAPGISQCTGAGCQFSGVASFNAGFGNAPGTSAVIFVGGGNFYNRTFTGGGLNCAGVLDGWMGVRSDVPAIGVCLGGTPYWFTGSPNVNEITVNGTVVIDSSRNLTNINDASIGGAATFTGGMVLSGYAGNSLTIGGGSFYTRAFSGADANCTGVDDGWLGIRTDTQVIEICAGGTEYTIGGGGGGGGSPSLPTNGIQYRTSGGAFGASSNFTYTPSTQQVFITGSSSSIPGLSISNGYAQTDTGFLALGCAVATCIQTPTGGVYAVSVVAQKYVQLGSSNGVPALTSGDAFHAGASYYDTGAAALEIYNGASWSGLAPGTGTPGGGITGGCAAVQYVASGPVFAGDQTKLCFNPTTQVLAVIGMPGAVTIDAIGGYIESDQGFETAYAGSGAINAPFGGGSISMLSLGNYPSSPPGFPSSGNAPTPSGFGGLAYKSGPIYWYWNGSAWASVDLSASGGSGANTALSNLTATAINQHLEPASSGGFEIGRTVGNTWNDVYISGQFWSSVAGSSYSIYTGPGGTFRVDGTGAVSAAGIIASTSATGGFNVYADTAQDSIVTVGGVQAARGFWISSTQQIINSSGGVNAGETQGVSARAFNPYTSAGVQDTGLDGTVGFNGTKLTWNGTAVNGIVFVGGVVVGTN